MKKMYVIIFFISILVTFPLNVFADEKANTDPQCPDCESIVKKYSKLNIKSVELLTDKPIYTIVTNDNKIMYVDGDKYMFIGAVMDMNTGANITLEKMNNMMNIKFSDFPLDKAILFKGTGKNRKKALAFVDINNVFSKKLLNDVQSLQNDIDVYIYLFPINPMDKKLMDMHTHIWCSKNKVEAIKNLLKGENIGTNNSCKTPIQDIMKIGAEKLVILVPTIFLSNDKIIRGYKDASFINNSFSDSNK